VGFCPTLLGNYMHCYCYYLFIVNYWYFIFYTAYSIRNYVINAIKHKINNDLQNKFLSLTIGQFYLNLLSLYWHTDLSISSKYVASSSGGWITSHSRQKNSGWPCTCLALHFQHLEAWLSWQHSSLQPATDLAAKSKGLPCLFGSCNAVLWVLSVAIRIQILANRPNVVAIFKTWKTYWVRELHSKRIWN